MGFNSGFKGLISGNVLPALSRRKYCVLFEKTHL